MGGAAATDTLGRGERAWAWGAAQTRTSTPRLRQSMPAAPHTAHQSSACMDWALGGQHNSLLCLLFCRVGARAVAWRVLPVSVARRPASPRLLDRGPRVHTGDRTDGPGTMSFCIRSLLQGWRCGARTGCSDVVTLSKTTLAPNDYAAGNSVGTTSVALWSFDGGIGGGRTRRTSPTSQPKVRAYAHENARVSTPTASGPLYARSSHFLLRSNKVLPTGHRTPASRRETGSATVLPDIGAYGRAGHTQDDWVHSAAKEQSDVKEWTSPQPVHAARDCTSIGIRGICPSPGQPAPRVRPCCRCRLCVLPVLHGCAAVFSLCTPTHSRAAHAAMALRAPSPTLDSQASRLRAPHYRV